MIEFLSHLLDMVRPHLLTLDTSSKIGYLAGGLATVGTTITAAWVAVKKLGPERTQVEVSTAGALVDMAAKNAQMSSEQAERLLRENEEIKKQITALQKQAEEVARLRQEVADLRRELAATEAAKDEALAEAGRLRDRVEALEAEITRLHDNGSIPPSA